MASANATPAPAPENPAPAERPFDSLSDAVTYLTQRKDILQSATSIESYREKLEQLHQAYCNESNDAITTQDCFHIFALLSSVAEYEQVVNDLIELEKYHRILSAEYMNHANGVASADVTPLDFDAAIQFIPDEHMVAPNSMAPRTYGNRILDSVRPAALQIFFKGCACMASLWGEFLAHEYTTVQQFVLIMDDFVTDYTPQDRSLQVSPMFSRAGAIQGWNAFAAALDKELEDHASEFSATKCSLERLKEISIAASRKCFAAMATMFQTRVPTWSWTTVPFTDAEKSYDAAFKNFLRLVNLRGASAASSSTAVVPSFSLSNDTATVRAERVAPAPSSTDASTRFTQTSSGRPSKVRRLNGQPLREAASSSAADEESSSDDEAESEARRRAELLRNEQEKCRRRMERREANRMRNRELPSWLLKERYMHDLRQQRHQVQGDAEEYFELDDPDSDNDDLLDDKDIYLNSKKDVTSINSINERVDLEVLYDEILTICVDPRSENAAPSLWSYLRDHGGNDSAWLREFLSRNLGMFLVESTRAPDSLHYIDHQKVMIHLEAHYQLATALFETFPHVLRDRTTWPLIDELDTEPFHKDRFVLNVEKYNKTRLLANLQCRTYSADHNVRRSLISAFPGMSVCVGYFKKSQGPPKNSPLMLFLCRYITQDSTNIAHHNADGNQLDDVKVYLMCSRYCSDGWNVGFDDVITLIPFASFVTITRQLRAAHDLHRLPESLREIIYEPQSANPRVPLPRRKLPRNRQQYDASLPQLDTLRAKVDTGSLAYVDSLSANICDESQKRAIITSLAEMGDMRQDSSSMSGIFGPPGTGKSTSICLAIGALLHHSRVGHVGDNATRRSVLKSNTKMIFSNDDGIRILVTCPSNYGVDHIAEKLKSGIPGVNGDIVFPKIVRIGRHNYDYKTLEDISVQKLGLPYDAEVYDPEEGITAPRRHPSRRARHQVGQECVVFLCTTSTAAGPMLKNLRACFSVVIMDEAGHASEQDTLCGLVAGVRQRQVNGLHVILVGDSNQLKPVFISQHPAVTFVNKNRLFYFKSRGVPISMNRQFISMFERLYERERCPFSWLTHQYRSHPHMARICTAHMYGDILVHPNDVSAYEKPYNSVLGLTPLQPLTVVDTRLTLRRGEITRGGTTQGIHNRYEAEIINELLFEIRRNRGHASITNNIIVTTPYRAQLRLLRDTLSEPHNFMSQQSGNSALQVAIDTIDSLQGSESSIVVISLTRSNRRKVIGFLRDNHRLNVAVTRAKHLLVLVGDFSTMCASDFMASIYRRAVDGAPGTAFRLTHPSESEKDQEQWNWVQDNVGDYH